MLPSVEQRMRGSASPAAVSGIVERFDGERAVPESRRSDGTIRKERKVRPGFMPAEDVGKYRSAKQLEYERVRPPGYVPGLPTASTSYAGAPSPVVAPANGPLTKSAKKNLARQEKRREARETTEEEGSSSGKAIEVPDDWDDAAESTSPKPVSPPPKPKAPREARPTALFASALAAATSASPEADREKRARALQKKLRQAEQLRERAGQGDALLPEQNEKVASIESLEAELASLSVKST